MDVAIEVADVGGGTMYFNASHVTCWAACPGGTEVHTTSGKTFLAAVPVEQFTEVMQEAWSKEPYLLGQITSAIRNAVER
jgi:hypothetical protein